MATRSRLVWNMSHVGKRGPGDKRNVRRMDRNFATQGIEAVSVDPETSARGAGRPSVARPYAGS
jgi:hypothetical protein